MGGLVTLLLMAALALDTGMMLLERRDQQNAADAAAIAGARYLPGDPNAARAAAVNLATVNGFTDGTNSASVVISIPPGSSTSSLYRNASSIEVTISSTRPSVFAGVMGVAGWPVGSRAVATNQDDIAAPFAMLALEPHECKAISVGGTGTITANGDIQVNSDCDKKNPGALDRDGSSTITVKAALGACRAVGTINEGPKAGDFDCTALPNAAEVPDPLTGLPSPPMPDDLADAMELVAGEEGLLPPDGCPGSTAPATPDDPALCAFSANVAYKDATWLVHPGLYPGGLDLNAGTFHLLPGIYWIGGGGFTAGGNGVTLISVATAADTTVGGGVLLYNSQLDGSGIGKISLNGSYANIGLLPLDLGVLWDGLVVFQDRIDIGGDSVNDVIINGGSSELQVRGTIYVPDGQVLVTGSSGTIKVDQVIADQFKVTGSGGTISVLYNPDYMFKLVAAGLVE